MKSDKCREVSGAVQSRIYHKLTEPTPVLWALIVLAVFWAQNGVLARWEEIAALDPKAMFGE